MGKNRRGNAVSIEESFDFARNFWHPDEFWGDRLDLESSRWVDPHGARRGKISYPYSYSEFYILGGAHSSKGKDIRGDYSDRLWQWDHEKASRLWTEHCNEAWERVGPDKLSKFISSYHGRELTVTALAEGCNPSNGYPYWIIWWKPAAPLTEPAKTE